MAAGIIFVTGTDTGVGKTVVTALLAGYLRAHGQEVAAIKPVCSGSRSDARILRAALGTRAALDQINPWHFRPPVAPLLAARAEGRRISQEEVLAFIRQAASRVEVLLVEGAGGLLSPLGEGFNASDLIAASGAVSVVVCPNRLGAVNQALLVLAALPRRARRLAQVVLISQRRLEAASRTNARLLEENLRSSSGRSRSVAMTSLRCGPLIRQPAHSRKNDRVHVGGYEGQEGCNQVHVLPWLGARWNLERALGRTDVQKVLAALVADLTTKGRRINPL